MNLLLPLLASTVALPAVVAGALAATLRRWCPLPVAAALAVGLAYVAGHLGVRGWRGWVPRESTDWLPVIALAGVLLGATGAVRRGPQALSSLLRLACAGGALWLVLGRVLTRQHTGLALFLEVALPAAVLSLAWSSLEALSGPRARLGPLALLLLVALGGAAVLLVSGSALLGQAAGVLASALGGLLLVSARRPGAGLMEGAVPVVALTLGSQLARVTLDSAAGRAPAYAALLLAAAPLAAWLVAVEAARRAQARVGADGGTGADGEADAAGPGVAAGNARRFGLQFAAAGLCVAGAVAVALAASPPADGSGS